MHYELFKSFPEKNEIIVFIYVKAVINESGVPNENASLLDGNNLNSDMNKKLKKCQKFEKF